ncbi:hypothetical protein MKS88_001604 [Plasmodium brasilianum]|uniref:Uncharacterized protein n=1 Tax=Plasmodium brasilianum TaxID=5824 RepID=A0ACB9YF44_PLABR|nr:hypothetical protein MKS88_000351 [Plasmodium brasilianum]KAI4840246.1 hypothetical protein MKS88_001604 [Plasmodium brasilianum]
MYYKNLLLLFIKIDAFILLSWIFLFNHNNMFNKSLSKDSNSLEKLDKRSCRLLAKYNNDKDSNVLVLKDLPYKGEHEKIIITNNKRRNKEKNKQSIKRLPMLGQFKLIPATTPDNRTEINAMILKYLSSLLGLKNEGHTFILLFAVTFLMLAILVTIATYKILRKNEKCHKIKLITE